MENIICIDLRTFNHVKLKEVCEKLELNFESILQNKYDGFAKLWIDKQSKLIISFTTKKDNRVQQTDDFSNYLDKINPVVLSNLKQKFDIDTILDKISLYGIDSLKEEEKDFLKNLK